MAVRIDVTLSLRRSLLDRVLCDALQLCIRDLLPTWATEFSLRRGRVRIPIDIERSGALADFIRADATDRGPLYRQLASIHPPEYERPLGSAEFRGATRESILVIIFDALAFAPIGGGYHWGNSVSFQICRAHVENQRADDWAVRALQECCTALPVDHGFACRIDEYTSKNMDLSNGARAIGRDVSRFLPGIYWLNFFGLPYVHLIGEQKLRSCPGFDVKPVGDGFFVSLGPRSNDWGSDTISSVEQDVLDWLGREYFFERADPDKRTTGLGVR